MVDLVGTCPNPESLEVGDIVTVTGEERLRILHLYEGCDEIVVETIAGAEWTAVGEVFDFCGFDVTLVERPE